MRGIFASVVVGLVLLWLMRSEALAQPAEPSTTQATAAPHGAHGSLGHRLPFATVAPFVLLLTGIAVLPLVRGHWWEQNRNKALVSGLLAAPIVVYLCVAFGEEGQHQLLHTAAEYASFIVLLGALFVISGGTYVRGTLAGTPEVNASILGLGALVASFVGTTGASMLLIRPLLRANAARARKSHIAIFFIFIVSNCGGLLTPLGDPPLYLGFLHGVPFEWTFRLWREWLVVNGALLLIFYVWDWILWSRDRREIVSDEASREPLRLDGGWNILFLLGVVAIIYCSGNGIGTGGEAWKFPVPEGLMLLLAILSYALTPRTIHRDNRFSFDPIAEVAIVFAGIFATMIPALLLLNAHGKAMGVREPWQFFWVTGILSSALDNAPTYLTFAATACGLQGIDVSRSRYLEEFLAAPGGEALLAAISCGAVMMGANTYIGNGPNFMVKAIAEQSGVRMPSFFRYMLYSGTVLIPLFLLMTWLFFWPQ